LNKAGKPNTHEIKQNTTEMGSRQHDDAVDAARSALSQINMPGASSPSSVSSSASTVLNHTAATSLNSSSSVRSAVLSNAPQAKASSDPQPPTATALNFLRDLEMNSFEEKYSSSHSNSDKFNPSAAEFRQSSPAILSAIQLEQRDEHADLFQIRCLIQNSSPSSSPSHRHRRAE